MSEYYKCLIKCKLIEKDNGIIPDIPFIYYSFTAILQGGKRVDKISNRLDLKNEYVMAYIHVKLEDKLAIKSLNNFIGDTFEDIKANEEYQLFYPYTVKDLKNKYDDNGQLIEEYLGEDKDEQAIFFQKY